MTEKPANSTPEAKAIKRSKTHQDYWSNRVCQRTYRNSAGQEILLTDWQVYIQHLGKRVWFQLDTPVKAAAAKKAAEIYSSLRAVGWETTLEKYKPASRVIQSPTVGEFLEAAEATGEIKPKTFALYARKFRKIVSDLARVAAGKDKFKHRGAGAGKWREKVDAVKLSAITPEAVEAWRKGYIEAAGSDATKRDAAANTANSAIRNARSLFSESIAAKLVGVQLPKPLSFDGVQVSADRNARYVSRINPESLAKAATKELGSKQPEAFKIFLLALFCGLRRNEIDKLLWNAVDLDKGTLRIELNPYFTPKATSSLGEVYLEPEIIRHFKQAKKGATGEFVIESPNEPRLGITYDHYRANEHFQILIDWLGKHGVKGNNPIHTLRKEFGRLITERHGIYAASKLLRHSSILVTSSYYADDQRRLTAGLGASLIEKRK